MKLTIETIKQLIKEELEEATNPQSNCPPIDEKIIVMLKSRNKDLILQGLAFVDAMWGMDVEFHAHGGTPLGDGTPDPRVHIEIKGRDAEEMFLCLGLDKLVSNARMNKYRQTGIYKAIFIPTGMRGNTFANHF